MGSFGNAISEYDKYALPVYITSTLSILGSGFILLSFLVLPIPKTPSLLLTLWLAISGFCFAALTFAIIGQSESDYENSYFCKIIPAVEIYFNLSAAFTTVIVAICIGDIFFKAGIGTEIKVCCYGNIIYN